MTEPADPSSKPSEFESKMLSRLDKLEQESRLRFAIQVVAAPILLAALGFFFNYQIEKAKSDFQRFEVDTKRVEAVKGMLPELFSETPDRALIAESVVTSIVDENSKNIIQKAVQTWIKSKIDSKFENAESNPAKSTADISAIKNAAQELTGPSAEAVQAIFAKPDFYAVVVSERTQAAAIGWAMKFRSLRYAAEV